MASVITNFGCTNRSSQLVLRREHPDTADYIAGSSSPRSLWMSVAYSRIMVLRHRNGNEHGVPDLTRVKFSHGHMGASYLAAIQLLRRQLSDDTLSATARPAVVAARRTPLRAASSSGSYLRAGEWVRLRLASSNTCTRLVVRSKSWHVGVVLKVAGIRGLRHSAGSGRPGPTFPTPFRGSTFPTIVLLNFPPLLALTALFRVSRSPRS